MSALRRIGFPLPPARAPGGPGGGPRGGGAGAVPAGPGAASRARRPRHARFAAAVREADLARDLRVGAQLRAALPHGCYATVPACERCRRPRARGPVRVDVPLLLVAGRGFALAAAIAIAAALVVLLSLRAGSARLGALTVTPVDAAAVGALVA